MVDVTDQTGMSFVHTDGASGRHYVVESMLAGLAIFDYDGDGLLDVYCLNGSALPGTVVATPPTNVLYRNLGGFKFQDVTEKAGVADAGYGLGVVAGDYDNDGDYDLVISNFGPNSFYLNNGDGTFTDITGFTGTSAGERFGAGVAFLDIEGDGDLDLYCANYQKFTFDQHITRMVRGYQFHPGPADYPPEPDMLFRNNGDGTFSDISEESGVSTVAGTGMGVIATDIEPDGDCDIVVANDSRPNFLFVNDGQGRFSENAMLAGFALDRAGRANGNMGVDCGDADGDGLIDIITTTFQAEMPVLYRNEGGGFFADVTNASRVSTSLLPHVNWGVSFTDFDRDGDRDIFIACGHFMDNIQYIDDRTTMMVQNYLLQNDGRGRFQDVSPMAGSGMQIIKSSRGAAIDDLDNDGRPDAVILNFNDQLSALQNRSADSNHWLGIRLVGVTSNRDGAGARVTLLCNGVRQVAEVYNGRGYQSHYGTQLFFGLGADLPDSMTVEVAWPGGKSQAYTITSIDQTVLLIQTE
ncbi:MAG: CRTAC1 family protein [Planctomycetales bacterium]|nr:CRTAC1 family protein [Planctomycetales bacterium]